jgi:hypothetical protein
MIYVKKVLPPFPIYDVVMENILRRKLKTK